MPAPYRKYVVGFMVSPETRQVVLIGKLKPEEQRGKLNGVGGKIEAFDETPAHAMAREFREETGVDTHPDVWDFMGVLRFSCGEIHCFRNVVEEPLHEVRATTLEVPAWVPLEHLHSLPLFNNVQWLVHLAFSQLGRIAFDVATLGS